MAKNTLQHLERIDELLGGLSGDAKSRNEALQQIGDNLEEFIESIASGAGLPDTTQANNGDVLTYNSGDIIWSAPAGGGSGGGSDLPPYENETPGKVLGLTADSSSAIATAASWIDVFPDTAQANNGDVLTYTYDGVSGDVVWSAIFPSYDGDDEGKVLSVTPDCSLAWSTINAIPAYDSNYAGYVLAVNDRGTALEWIDPSTLTNS